MFNFLPIIYHNKKKFKCAKTLFFCCCCVHVMRPLSKRQRFYNLGETKVSTFWLFCCCRSCCGILIWTTTVRNKLLNKNAFLFSLLLFVCWIFNVVAFWWNWIYICVLMLKVLRKKACIMRAHTRKSIWLFNRFSGNWSGNRGCRIVVIEFYLRKVFRCSINYSPQNEFYEENEREKEVVAIAKMSSFVWPMPEQHWFRTVNSECMLSIKSHREVEWDREMWAKDATRASESALAQVIKQWCYC